MTEKIMKGLIKVSLPFVAVLGLLFTMSCGKTPDSSKEKFDIVHEVIYSFRLQKSRDGSGQAVANLYLPLTQEGRQKLLSYSISGTIKQKPREINDELGNRYLRYEFSDIPQDFVGTVKVKVKVGQKMPEASSEVADEEKALNSDDAFGNQVFRSNLALVIEDYGKSSLSGSDKKTCVSQALDFFAIAENYGIYGEAIVGVERDNKDQQLACWAQVYMEHNDSLIDLSSGADVDKHNVKLRAFKNMESMESASLQGLVSSVYGFSVDFSFEK